MWLHDRLKDLNMTLGDFAVAVDLKEQTIKNWVFTRGYVPRHLEEIEFWQKAANALNWTILDVLRAAGYTFPTDTASVDMQRILARVQRLSDEDRAIVIRFMSGLLDVAEDDGVTDLPLGD